MTLRGKTIKSEALFNLRSVRMCNVYIISDSIIIIIIIILAVYLLCPYFIVISIVECRYLSV